MLDDLLYRYIRKLFKFAVMGFLLCVFIFNLFILLVGIGALELDRAPEVFTVGLLVGTSCLYTALGLSKIDTHWKV